LTIGLTTPVALACALDCHAHVLGVLLPTMVENATIRRLALSLPEVEAGESEDSLAFSVRGKGLAWPYLARATPKGRREVVPGVLAVRCLIESKAMLIEAAPEIYFDDDHYRGYPAVLVRLAVIEAAELERLLAEAWRRVAPKALVKRFGQAK
jgi:hypothetical protein